jgi:hypothetical protein
MTLTAVTGTAMALVVSSVVKTERAALTAVPLLLVPQMLLTLKHQITKVNSIFKFQLKFLVTRMKLELI